jgi:hypothetical protein
MTHPPSAIVDVGSPCHGLPPNAYIAPGIKLPAAQTPVHALQPLVAKVHRHATTRLGLFVVMHNFPTIVPSNMQTVSSALGRKRPLSPETQFGAVTESKRRATTDKKPFLQVNTMVPPRPTPELLPFPTTSPFHTRSFATYADTVDYTTSFNQVRQSMRPQAAADWMQYTGAMHTTLSTNNLQYYGEAGFLESCKSSVESSSSYSIFSSLSGLSSSHNPFRDLCSTFAPDPSASLPVQADTDMPGSIDTILTRLQRLQDVLTEQSKMLEEVMQALKGN